MNDHIESMKSHMLGQFVGKPVFEAFLTAIGGELNELEQMFTDLRDKRWIDTAEGAQLDGIGEIVNQNRQVPDAVTIPFSGLKDSRMPWDLKKDVSETAGKDGLHP